MTVADATHEVAGGQQNRRYRALPDRPDDKAEKLLEFARPLPMLHLILIVEDDPMMLDVLAGLFSDEGYRVQCAEDGQGHHVPAGRGRGWPR